MRSREEERKKRKTESDNNDRNQVSHYLWQAHRLVEGHRAAVLARVISLKCGILPWCVNEEIVCD